MSEYMTGKEVVNLIRKLKEKGMSSDEILEIIEYIETHDPKETNCNPINNLRCKVFIQSSRLYTLFLCSLLISIL